MVKQAAPHCMVSDCFIQGNVVIPKFLRVLINSKFGLFKD